VDGDTSVAEFLNPNALLFDMQGNMFVADNGNYCIRKVTPSGEVSTIAGSTAGYMDGEGADAKFNYPVGLAIDGQGNVYVADAMNNRVRKISFE